MWIILTEPADQTGTWLANGLRQCTSIPVHHLTSRDLGQVERVETGHENGAVQFRARLSSGFVIDSRILEGVVNRVIALPPGIAARRNCPERMAAVRNFTSPVWRLLAGAPCTILNRPTAQGLSGDYRLAAEWTALARAAGLPPLEWESDQAPATLGPGCGLGRWGRVAVIGKDVVALEGVDGSLPGSVEEACRELADAASLSMLGIDLVDAGRSEWHYAGIDVRPDLSTGGAPALAAVVRALGGKPDRSAAGNAGECPLGHPGASWLTRMGPNSPGTMGRSALWRLLHP